MAPPTRAPELAKPVRALLVATLAIVCVGWAIWLAPSPRVPVAPVTGVAVVVMLGCTVRRWPFVMLAAAAGVMAVFAAHSVAVVTSLSAAIAVALGAVTVATLLRGYGRGARIDGVRDLAALIVLGCVGGLVSTAAVWVGGLITRPDSGAVWSVAVRRGAAETLGAIVLVALVHAWADLGHTRSVPRPESLVLFAACVGGAVVLAAWSWSAFALCAAATLLICAAVQGRVWGAAAVLVAAAGVVDWALVRGAPFIDHQDLGARPVLGAQLAYAVAVGAALVVAAALDERDGAHATRQQAVERYRRAFSNAPIGMALTTLGGVVLEANPVLCDMLGRTRVQLVGVSLHSLRRFDEPDGEPLVAPDVVATGEQRLVGAGGSVLWVQVSETPIRSLGGEEERRIVSIQDVTPRKVLEDQLIHAQKMEAVGRLAGGVAHDFNNLVAVMRGHVELLEDDLAVLENARARLASVQRATDRAAAITDDLVAFSRRGADEAVSMDVHEVVTGLHGMLGQLIGDSVTITLKLDAEHSVVRAAPTRIEQALVNLIINSRDAMPAGGRVTIATRNEGDAGDRRVVALTIADTGLGMDEDTQRRIFEPFFTTKARGAGTGLGLAITSGIVDGYGGTISVESAPRKGTTFTVTLPVDPLAPAHLPAPAESRPAARPDPRRGTVLVVDDEVEVGRVVADMLRECGYRVLEATDPRDALAIVDAADPPIDLVLSDVVMPVLGGPDLLEHVRRVAPDMRMLFMSGYPELDPRAPGLRETRVLRKPVRRAELVAEVDAVLAAPPPQGSKR